jgi:DNA-binding response OmpR family regulator
MIPGFVPTTPPRRILVVDDDSSMARAAQRVLRQAGYETVTAGDGLVARSLVYGFKPQLVVLDLCMPNVDGIALTTLLRELAEATPSLACRLLIVSGAAQDRLELALQLGAHDVLPKPFDNDELLRRVARLLVDTSRAG